MGFRQVFIKSAKKLSLEDNQLIIHREKETNKVPLEDINFIILEDYTTIITSKLLSEISKYYISLIVCDEKHEPKTITFSYNQHYKQLEIFEKQININQELNDILWQSIINYKIRNQLYLIKELTDDKYSLDLLSNYINEIEPSDVTNREGLASKVYFRSLFGSEFIRFLNDEINSALDYGYTIIKSAIVRSLVSKVLVTYIGIHHKSKSNNFNLAYDLIEPYRPIVDKYVFLNKDRIMLPLPLEIRRELVNLLNERVLMNGKEYTVQFSIDLLVDSYIKSISENSNKLILPTIIV